MKRIGLLSFYVFLGITGMAQPPVDVWQVISPSNPQNCSETVVTINGWNDASNYTLQTMSHFLQNDTIFIDIPYTAPQIVLGVLTQWQHTYNLGNVYVGNYTIVARGYLDNTYQSSANGWLPVTACCGSAVPEFDFVNDTVCPGDTVQVINNSYGSNLSYAWAFNGETDSTAAPMFTFETGGTYHVTLTVTGDSCSDSLVKEVEVLVAPQIDLGADTVLCAGDSHVLSLPSSNSYWWSNGAVTSSIAVYDTGSTWVMATSDDGCTAMDTFQITDVLEYVDFTLGPDQQKCTGDSVQLATTQSGTMYWWSTGDTAESITIQQPGTYWLTLHAQGFCPNRDTVVVSNHAVEALAFELGSDSCGSRNIEIISNHDTAYWSNGASGLETVFDTAGLYYVDAWDANGCDYTDSIWVEVKPLPVFSLGADTFLCGDQSILLSTQLSGDHFWSNGSTGAGMLVNMTGVYSVLYVDQFGCSASDTIVVSDCLGRDGPVVESNATYFDPIRNIIHSQNRGPAQIFDPSGRILMSFESVKAEIPVAMLPAGLYLFISYNDEAVSRCSFVKH